MASRPGGLVPKCPKRALGALGGLGGSLKGHKMQNANDLFLFHSRYEDLEPNRPRDHKFRLPTHGTPRERPNRKYGWGIENEALYPNIFDSPLVTGVAT